MISLVVIVPVEKVEELSEELGVDPSNYSVPLGKGKVTHYGSRESVTGKVECKTEDIILDYSETEEPYVHWSRVLKENELEVYDGDSGGDTLPVSG